MPTLAHRFANLVADDPAASLQLVAGTMRDYAALAEHHYRARRPATVTRIFALRRERPNLAAAFRKSGANTTGRTQTVAVLVESMPTLNCRLRDLARGDRYRRIRDNRRRARLINRELRCISRVIVHPQWRGLGLAVQLVRHALTTATTDYTEALAAMGRAHPLFERAGMTAYRDDAMDRDQLVPIYYLHENRESRQRLAVSR